MKKVAALLLFLVLVAGLGIGTYLALNPQIFKPKASCTGSGCVVEVGLTPTQVTKTANTNFDLIVTVDTKGQDISGLQFVLKYPSDATDLTMTSIDLDPAIASSGWTKRIGNETTSGTDKQMQFSATYNGSWNSNGTVNFAKLTLHGNADTVKNITFDSGLSKALSGVNATDILTQPTSSSVVTIGAGGTPPPPPPSSNTYYKCSGTSCVVDSNGTGFANDPTCNNTCTAAAPKYYKCSGATCVQDTSGGKSFANDSTCNNSCTAAAPKYYKCSGTACVQDTSGGTNYTNDSSCNNACTSGAAAPKYKCNATACVRDDSGPYTATDCNGACTGNNSGGGGTGGGGTVSSAISVSTIANGANLTALPSKISGKSGAYAKLTLTIQSDPITGTVTADANGNWIWYPQGSLATGAHTLTVSDASGNTKTVNFTISAASAGTSPTTLPASGAVENTIIVTIFGLVLFSAGLIVLRL